MSLDEFTLLTLKFLIPLDSCFIEICIWGLQEQKDLIYPDYGEYHVADGINQEKIGSLRKKSVSSI